jgi:hypothetical protein
MNSEMVVVASDTTVSAESVTAGLCREPMEVRAESLPAVHFTSTIISGRSLIKLYTRLFLSVMRIQQILDALASRSSRSAQTKTTSTASLFTGSHHL